MEKTTVHVPAISCGHCTATIEREIGELPGVVTVSAAADSRQVTVSWEAPASWSEIAAVLADIGFPPADS